MNDFEKTHPHLKDFSKFLPELNAESDRGAVLISCSYIDELLSKTISSFLVECEAADKLLNGFNAPLGTFSARIAVSYALGLIEEREYCDVEIIRKIRNKFAHAIHISFEDQAVKDLCANLNMSAKNYGDVVVGTKGQFVTAATSLILHLTNRPHYVAKLRLEGRNWPY